MRYYLKLIRPINLIIVGLTMFAIRYYFFSTIGCLIPYSHIEFIHFLLLILSTILVAAAGNVINDYFDVKADKINKPEHLIINKYISKQKAIKLHWKLNVIALLIASYLSIYYHTFWYFAIHFITICALWLYSSYFKRKFLLGNILIAGLTATVIGQCGFYFYSNGDFHPLNYVKDNTNSIINAVIFWENTSLQNGNYIIFLCVFAFLLNLAREIIKDLEDIQGDKKLHAKTIALTLGNKKTSWIIFGILVCVGITYPIILFGAAREITFDDIIITLPILMVSIVSIYASIQVVIYCESQFHLKQIDKMLKIGMIIGILIPFYWALF